MVGIPTFLLFKSRFETIGTCHDSSRIAHTRNRASTSSVRGLPGTKQRIAGKTTIMRQQWYVSLNEALFEALVRDEASLESFASHRLCWAVFNDSVGSRQARHQLAP
jgi:hypothetical protein